MPTERAEGRPCVQQYSAAVIGSDDTGEISDSPRLHGWAEKTSSSADGDVYVAGTYRASTHAARRRRPLFFGVLLLYVIILFFARATISVAAANAPISDSQRYPRAAHIVLYIAATSPPPIVLGLLAHAHPLFGSPITCNIYKYTCVHALCVIFHRFRRHYCNRFIFTDSTTITTWCLLLNEQTFNIIFTIVSRGKQRGGVRHSLSLSLFVALRVLVHNVQCRLIIPPRRYCEGSRALKFIILSRKRKLCPIKRYWP